jgi:sec-independent protein translocase protein TatB
MFDIGWSELLVIGVVALIAIGPKELPGVLRSVGHWMGKIRSMASEFQGQFQEAMREAEMSDLKKHADDLNSVTKALTSGLDPYNIMRDVNAETKPAATESTSTEIASTPAADAQIADAAPVSLDPQPVQETHAPEPIAAGSPEVVHEPVVTPAPAEPKAGA